MTWTPSRGRTCRSGQRQCWPVGTIQVGEHERTGVGGRPHRDNRPTAFEAIPPAARASARRSRPQMTANIDASSPYPNRFGNVGDFLNRSLQPVRIFFRGVPDEQRRCQIEGPLRMTRLEMVAVET